MAGTYGVRVGGESDAAFYMVVGGLRELQRGLREEFDDVMDDLEAALWDGLEREILRPANVICPKDTGLLVSTGYVNVQRKRGRISGMVGYDTDYAIYVHENPDARHKPPTRWKWLEETLVLNADRLLDRVEADVRRRQ